MTTSDITVKRFQIKVTLMHVRPPIWRRLRVPGYLTLGDLHKVLQVAMGWQNMHLHDFAIDGVYYGPILEAEDSEALQDEKHVELQSVLREEGARGLYRYDFGDDWWHQIEVERIETVPASEAGIVCMAGRRAGPPEGCGGPPGYAMLMQALRRRAEPAFRDWIESYGDFDPERFDRKALNLMLARIG